MVTGRPSLFNSPEELQAKVDQYFESVRGIDPNTNGNIKKLPITITGLALYLGFESRQSFYDYEKNELFSYIIKRARTMVEYAYELRLEDSKPTGAIFALKNLGWVDSREYKHEVKDQPLFPDPNPTE